MTIAETLYVEILHENEESIELNMELLNAQAGTSGLFSRLKSFHLYQSIGHTNEMQFIEFLMSKATVLQEIEISVHDKSSKSMEVVSDELFQYKKASPQAKVIVKRYVSFIVDCTYLDH
ncbi:hypothetical protein BAE44_0018965 [Dichanthelium oligosanthes]|uniref:FBD domain-containing protein n=1 Tax=Dichanthelium oligosanthes TaxID=888268 RepID=A0A1E5V4L9_9POAL|nr:hypothetical protein BAE44_0018965 [Dichanthelium oligosanthes]